MAKTRYLQNSFLSGELSPLIKGNSSLAQYYQGLEQASNVLVVPQGGVKRRAGLEFVALNVPSLAIVAPSAVTMANGGSTTNVSDDDLSTSSTTTSPIGTTSASSSYVIAQFDFGTAKNVYFADVDQLEIIPNGNSGYVSHIFRFEFSADASTWTASSGSTFSLDTSPIAFNKRITAKEDAAFRYYRLVVYGATVLDAATVKLSGINFFVDAGIAAGAAKNLQFNVSSDDRYLLAVTKGNIAIYSADATVLDGATENIRYDYSEASIKNLRHAVSENVALLFHEDYPVRRLIHNSSHVNPFLFEDVPFVEIPKFDFNDDLSPTPVAEQQNVSFVDFNPGDAYQIDVDSVLSKQISYAGDSATVQQTSTAANMQKNLQEMPNFGDTGITVTRISANLYRITIEGESADAFELFSGFSTSGNTSARIVVTKVSTGSPRKENLWSANRGYPRMGAFFEGRLWFGGTRDKKQTLLGSKSGALLNFATEEGDDDGAIFSTIISRTLTEITDIYPGRNLQVFTSGGEYASLEAGITPATFNIRSQTSNGSLYVPAEEADGAVIYCDKNGKTLREYVYTFNEDSYASSDISVLSSHLIKTPVDSAFLTGTASDDANWLFIINSDGTIAVLNKLRSQDINAFTPMSLTTQFNINSAFESVEVVDDKVFFSVIRYDENDVKISTIERLNFDYLMDGSIKATPGGATISGLSHLVGFEVNLVSGGAVLNKRTVDASGQITLTASEVANNTSYEVGVNFVPTIQPMPLNTNVGSGENYMRLKRIVRINLRVYETYGVYVDNVPVASRSFGDNVLNRAPVLFTGIIGDVYPEAGWERDVMPVFTCPDPTPMHIQAIEFEVESS